MKDAPYQPPASVLRISKLNVAYETGRQTVTAVRDFDLHIAPGETHGLIGGSGCGKSTIAYAIMRYLGHNGTITSGQIIFEGRDLLALDGEEMRRLRGSKIAMIYQEPMSALNPSMRIGSQLAEVPVLHDGASRKDAEDRARDILARVRIADVNRIMRSFPHQLSGGQQQRVVIAMALLGNPQLLLLDEPTTALDATVEAEIVALIKELAEEFSTALLFISHNLALVRTIADNITIMDAGRIVESGDARQLFARPAKAYTRDLISAIPDVMSEHVRTAKGETDAPLLKVEGLTRIYRRGSGWWPLKRKQSALYANEDVSFSVGKAETLAIIGESGSGKSTFARVATGLESADAGSVILHDRDIANLPVQRRKMDLIRTIQMVFQNPGDTLNPSLTIGFQIRRAMRVAGLPGSDAAMRLDDLFDQVQLPRDLAGRYPGELSGGQRQRAAIARALAAQPEIIIADEPLSALDVPVQAAISDMLRELQEKHDLALIFISHDLAMVRKVADRVVVMYRGRVIEQGSVEDLFAPPYHPYTQALLAAVPGADPGVKEQTFSRAEADAGSAQATAQAAPGAGRDACVFAGRCPSTMQKCYQTMPPTRRFGHDHLIVCHLEPEQLSTMQAVFPATANKR